MNDRFAGVHVGDVIKAKAVMGQIQSNTDRGAIGSSAPITVI
jgi:hypothetical protein